MGGPGIGLYIGDLPPPAVGPLRTGRGGVCVSIRPLVIGYHGLRVVPWSKTYSNPMVGGLSLQLPFPPFLCPDRATWALLMLPVPLVTGLAFPLPLSSFFSPLMSNAVWNWVGLVGKKWSVFHDESPQF